MTTVKELIDLYERVPSCIFINEENYKSIYDNIKVMSFDVGYCYDDYELWIYVDSEDKKEVDNNPFD